MSTSKATAAVLRAEEKKARAARPAAGPDPSAPAKDARAGEIEKLKAQLVNEKSYRRSAEHHLQVTGDELYRTKEALRVMSEMLATAESNVRTLHRENRTARPRDLDDDIPF